MQVFPTWIANLFGLFQLLLQLCCLVLVVLTCVYYSAECDMGQPQKKTLQHAGFW